MLPIKEAQQILESSNVILAGSAVQQMVSQKFSAHGVQPRKDGLGTPPFLGFFYSYTLRRHPKTLNPNTTPSTRLLWGTLGPGLVMPNFGVFLETPFWAGTPLGTPLPSQEGGFLGGFLGRNPPLPIPLPGQEPPFLDPSYDPSCPEAIAHKSVRWGLNRIVPPH